MELVERRVQEAVGGLGVGRCRAAGAAGRRPGRRRASTARRRPPLVVAGEVVPDVRHHQRGRGADAARRRRRPPPFREVDPRAAHVAELGRTGAPGAPPRASPSTATSARPIAASSSAAASAGSWWAPPSGSGTISSTMPAVEQVRRGQLQRRGGFDLAVRVAPENRGAAFRRDDAVDRELLNEHAVADRDARARRRCRPRRTRRR